MIGRRSLLKALILGAAVAFPITKLRLDDGLTPAERLARELAAATGRDVFVHFVGQSNAMMGVYAAQHFTNPKIYDWRG